MRTQTRAIAWWRAATWTFVCLVSMGLLFTVVGGAEDAPPGGGPGGAGGEGVRFGWLL